MGRRGRLYFGTISVWEIAVLVDKGSVEPDLAAAAGATGSSSDRVGAAKGRGKQLGFTVA